MFSYPTKTTYDESEKVWRGTRINSVFNPNVSLGQTALQILNLNPEKIVQISVSTGEQLTAGELRVLAIRAAQHFANFGLTQNDVMGMIASNSHFLAPLAFGALLYGIPFNPLDPSFDKGEIKHMFGATKPKIVFCDASCYQKTKQALEELESSTPIYLLTGSLPGVPTVEKFFKPTGNEDLFIPPFLNNGRNHTAVIICSSGTTGLPKGVCMSHHALLAHTESNPVIPMPREVHSVNTIILSVPKLSIRHDSHPRFYLSNKDNLFQSSLEFPRCTYTISDKDWQKAVKMSRAVFSTNFDEDEKIWSGRSLNTLFNPNITLGQVILNTLNMMPEKVVQISAGTDKKITAMQMVGLSVRASQNYELSGYKQDDVIGLVASNTHFLAPLVFGAFLNGIIVNPLDPSFSKDEIKHMFNITKPKAVFCDSQVYENVKEALVEIECISPIYVMDDSETSAPSVRQFLKPTGREQSFIPPQLNQGEDPIAAIVCSSGTTGLPKGVIVTHRALLANCATSLPSTEVCFSFTTLYWLSGLTLLIMGTLRCFTRIIIDQPFSPEVLLYLIEKYKISVVVAPPSQMVLTVQSSHFKTLDLSSLKYYICGGSAVPINAAIEMKKHLTNVSLWISYALSETGGNVTFAFDLNNSVGQVAPNVQVKILDEDSKPLGIGAKGEICVKFLYKLYGYYCNVEATKNIFDEEGWLHTGDIGYFDELGYLYIVDRKKEIMKYKNFHFSPTEIEHVIMDIPDVVECCVFGVSDEVATDLPAAAIVKKEGSVLNEDDIRNHVTSHMADFKQLRGGVYFANSLPKTASGKIIRRKVKDFFDKRVDPINN